MLLGRKWALSDSPGRELSVLLSETCQNKRSFRKKWVFSNSRGDTDCVAITP